MRITTRQRVENDMMHILYKQVHFVKFQYSQGDVFCYSPSISRYFYFPVVRQHFSLFL